MRSVRVCVERLAERYCGQRTGRMVYHTGEFGCRSGLFRGCPLGRGYTEAESLADFVRRANADDSALRLSVAELTVAHRHDRGAY